MIYRINYLEKVKLKDITKLSAPIRMRIKKTIEDKLASNPFIAGKPLRYSLKGCRSMRVGDYRIIYQIFDDNITIIAIEHRKDCYNQ